MRSLVAVLSIAMAVGVSAAPMQAFKFDDPQQEKIFQRLGNEIRCLVCQNQAIADSNAELAQDLKTEIYNMLQQGKSEQEIIDFLVQRYGDFVLYKPPFKPVTWLLWFGPLLMFFVALYFALRFVSSQQSKITSTQLGQHELQRLKSLQSQVEDSHTDQSQASKD